MAKVDYDSILNEYPFPPAVKEEIKSELEKLGLTKTKAKKVVEKCFKAYLANLMEPGEAAGIVAAQSIGEPCTQMSVPYDEKLIVKTGDRIKVVEIGNFVDECIDRYGCVREGVHEICDLPEDFEALSLSSDEKIVWRKIKSVIRHKFNGKLLKIRTRSGREITATPYHSFVTKIDGKITPISGYKLRVGDEIPAVGYLPFNCIEVAEVNGEFKLLDFNSGYELGKIFSSGGNVDLGLVLSAKIEFVEGFVKAIVEEGVRKFELMPLIFARLGLFVSLEDLKIERAGEVVWDEIVSMEYVDYNGYVYDFSVEDTETFATASGLITHNTMRTFHYAGVAEINVTLGLPRLIEILDVRKNPSTPMMTIRLLPDYAKSREKAREVANRIEATYVKDIADIEVDIRNLRIIVKPDPKALERKGLTVEDLKNKISKSVKMEVEEQGDTFVIQITEPSYKVLMNTFEKLKDTVVMGIKEIKRVIVRKEGDEYVLYTEGSNLKKVMKVKGVDFTRTLTNNIYEIYEVLGIEAARNAIIKEALDTLEEQGLEVDARHIMLVADVMTADGELRQIGRHGVAGEKQSILARAAFEMTVNNLLEAAVKGEVDGLRGITENIIVGQPIKLGTGDVELIAKLGGRK